MTTKQLADLHTLLAKAEMQDWILTPSETEILCDLTNDLLDNRLDLNTRISELESQLAERQYRPPYPF